MTSPETAIEHLRMSLLSAEAMEIPQAAVMTTDLATAIAEYDRLANSEPTGDDTEALRTAYTERATLIALLAALYPSGWDYSDPEYPDWPVVYIDLPTGQASWHIHPDDWWIFANVERRHNAQWDGHSTDEKYQRIRHLIAAIEAGTQPRILREPVLHSAELQPANPDLLPAIAQQINMLLQLHAQCATCVADVRQGARPAPNLLNVIVDGTGYCHEHVDVVNGRLVPKTGSGLILGGR